MSGDTERVEIITRREQRVTETATLTLCEFADEIHLEDLRAFVQLTALLPGDAQVLTREDGIEITYVTTDVHPGDDTEVAHELAVALQERERRDAGVHVHVPSDVDMAELRRRLAGESATHLGGISGGI